MTKQPEKSAGPDSRPEAEARPAADVRHEESMLADLLRARKARQTEQAAQSKRDIKVAEAQDAVIRKMQANAAKNREE